MIFWEIRPPWDALYDLIIYTGATPRKAEIASNASHSVQAPLGAFRGRLYEVKEYARLFDPLASRTIKISILADPV
jgi:hypothetical protein